MKKLIFALIMAVLFFVLVNFVLNNLDDSTFGYSVVFKFKIPYVLYLKSMPIPLGFVILLSFCFGMVAIAILEALPSLFKTMEIRAKNKRIRQLERELSLVRQMAETSKKPQDEIPDNPSEEENE